MLLSVMLLCGGAATAAGAVTDCRNSFDPACGDFFWDPAPAPYDRGSAAISFTPEFPKPGEAVTFTITIDDPDGGSATQAERTMTAYGDETGPVPMVHCDPAWTFGYGPWDTPAESPFHEVVTLQHAYDAVGDYQAGFDFDLCGAGPYRDEYHVETTVPVRELPFGSMICVKLRAVSVDTCV
jgi:hypothetical protein